jgi:hypothetical protein
VKSCPANEEQHEVGTSILTRRMSLHPDPQMTAGSWSLLLPVPEADALVDPFRRRGDWSRALGVPAHLTLAGPWPADVPCPTKALADLSAEMRGARCLLDSCGLLGQALCLFLADEKPLLGWRGAALSAVGARDMTPSDWRPHLTVCRSVVDDGEEASSAIAPALPIEFLIGGLWAARRTGPGQVGFEHY